MWILGWDFDGGAVICRHLGCLLGSGFGSWWYLHQINTLNGGVQRDFKNLSAFLGFLLAVLVKMMGECVY